MFQPLSVKRCPVDRLTLVSFLPGASRRCPTLSRARTHEPARADILLMPVRMSAFGAPPAGPELRAARAEEERGLRSELGQARRAASRAQQRLASCSSEAAVALHSAAALAAKRSCEVEQLRAALMARPDNVTVCRGSFERFGAVDDRRSLRSGVLRDGLNHVQVGIAGQVLPPWLFRPDNLSRARFPRGLVLRFGVRPISWARSWAASLALHVSLLGCGCWHARCGAFRGRCDY